MSVKIRITIIKTFRNEITKLEDILKLYIVFFFIAVALRFSVTSQICLECKSAPSE